MLKLRTLQIANSCILWFGSILGLFVSCGREYKTPQHQESGEIFFVSEILPVLQTKCWSCHGDKPNELEGGLDLRFPKSLTEGGESGTALVTSGRPEFSLLYRAISRENEDIAMPPREREALTDTEVEAFYSWIVAGAPWPDDKKINSLQAERGLISNSRITVQTSGGQSDDWDERSYRKADLWAYMPLNKPQAAETTPDLHPIDFFINQHLDKRQLEPSSLEDRATLLRRACFDLLGLPPSQEQVDWFLNDREVPFVQLLDTLLSSPHYGEQWARHWLDVVRYADSDGFSNDYARPSAWRYRDYVIRSLNQDKPYDRFVTEQLAGDEIDSLNPEMLIASGFLRMGPWEHTGMSVAKETRQFYLDDVTNIVGEALLATPLNCARCHDHKYDPVPTRDYYQIQAIFATTQLAQREAAFLPEENTVAMAGEKERLLAWMVRTEEERRIIRDKEEKAARTWFQQRGKEYLPKRQRRKLDLSNQPPRYYGLTFGDLGYRKVLQKHAQIQQRNLDRFGPWAYSVYSGPDRVVHSNTNMRVPDGVDGKPAITTILKGGSVHSPSDTVEPDVLSVVHFFDSVEQSSFDSARSIPSGLSGRRKAFAKWIADPYNPLTARVMVNRIWQYHFGRGLAESPNNFGATGGKPSHPLLLDWLASEFIENGWSVKYLHKIIMTSEAYRRSSDHPNRKKIDLIDPDNVYLSYFSPRRLAAEEIRDAMLFISGELNTEMGGIPVRPEIPLEVALQPRHTMGSTSPAYQPSMLPSQRNRRSIYIERKRSIENPMLQVFNQNNTNFSCEKRESSNVVTQAFALMNDQNTRARALYLARQLAKEEPDVKLCLRRALETVLMRSAKSGELEKARSFLNEAIQYHRNNKPVEAEYPSFVDHEMFEEMTGEPFVYTEYLDVYDKYFPDIQDHQVTAEVRALADFISVLFNTNEFVYVY